MIEQIIKQWHEENFTMIDEAAQAALIAKLKRELVPRAEVAAALAALKEAYSARTAEGASIPWRAAFDFAESELDAAITKLGLAPEKEGK